ncbi:MAG: HNH endonuclease [Planctomycetales bacterium]|nr:HNH endonuclease [Planctomycetales bacterium]
MAFLPIYKGSGGAKTVVGKALVDDSLLPRLQHLELRYRGKYPYARVTGRGGVKTKNLHYIVWELSGSPKVKAGRFLDHVNNDLNDNRLDNLAVVHASTKNANAPRRSDSSTGYKCVRRKGAKFQSVVSYACEQLHIGSYDRASEAAYAVNHAYHILRPEVPTPNQIPPQELTAAQTTQIEENVMRLLHPRRAPRKKRAD